MSSQMSQVAETAVASATYLDQVGTTISDRYQDAYQALSSRR